MPPRGPAPSPAPLKFDGAGIPGLGPVHGPVTAKGREVAWIWYQQGRGCLKIPKDLADIICRWPLRVLYLLIAN